jgi:uncharacterized protein
MIMRLAAIFLLAVASIGVAPSKAQAENTPDSAKVELQWGVRIPLRDGVKLAATAYLLKGQSAPSPCVFTLTPYVADSYHNRGVYFAAHGLPFLTVDARGRGNSEGAFKPFEQEVLDTYDVVEWLAKQPYCNGKIAMWGGSYAGFNQWAAVKSAPPHLATIVPAASSYPGVDFPYWNNIASNYLFQWLTFTSGHALQDKIFSDDALWKEVWHKRYSEHAPFNNLEHAMGSEQPILRQWLSHPMVDRYYDDMAPSKADFARINMSILTITGMYDDDQPGALAYYKEHMRVASAKQRAQHFLVIGPWDHAGTRTPKAELGRLKFGPMSLLDLPKLHVDWYGWTMSGGGRPAFLQKRVAYYVTGAERWRYADTLEAVTATAEPLFLNSSANANSLAKSGQLTSRVDQAGQPDSYRYDPADISTAEVESKIDLADPTEQRLVIAQQGKSLTYQSDAYAADTEISGFFKLSAWISIDQADTDFQASVYEVTSSGQSILLTRDIQRARHRTSLRSQTLITSTEPLLYTFDKFTFASRRIAKGSRLRLIFGPINSIYIQKNYNSGKAVSDETIADARPVTVRLFHDPKHPSVLYVPLGQKD